MKRFLLTLSLISIFNLTGCTSLKEATGEYVTESVALAIGKKVDEKLAERKLSREEIINLIDQNLDGKITSEEALRTVKDFAKDWATISGQQIVDTKIKEISDNLVTKSQLDGKSQELYTYLITALGTMLSGYLGKQVFSAKNDGKRDERIAVLEKLLQKDINGDGVIGGNGNAQETVKT